MYGPWTSSCVAYPIASGHTLVGGPRVEVTVRTLHRGRRADVVTEPCRAWTAALRHELQSQSAGHLDRASTASGLVGSNLGPCQGGCGRTGQREGAVERVVGRPVSRDALAG